MRAVIQLWENEPILVMNLIKALIGLLAAFGLILTGAQTAAVVAVVAAVLTVLSSLKERQKVTPVKGRSRSLR